MVHLHSLNPHLSLLEDVPQVGALGMLSVRSLRESDLERFFPRSMRRFPGAWGAWPVASPPLDLVAPMPWRTCRRSRERDRV